MNERARWTSTVRSTRSWLKRLQSLRNSLKVFLLLMDFLARSKKLSSSLVAALDVVGGMGEGRAGMSVGDAGGWSFFCTMVCACLTRCCRMSVFVVAVEEWNQVSDGQTRERNGRLGPHMSHDCYCIERHSNLGYQHSPCHPVQGMAPCRLQGLVHRQEHCQQYPVSRLSCAYCP